MKSKTRTLVASAVIVLSALLATAQQQATLKDAFKDDFLIGVAINSRQIFENDASGVAIIKTQFNSISPENILKWEVVHPQPRTYDFAASDRYVEFGEQNHMFIIGHNLVWHNQVPKWVFEDKNGKPLTRKKLLKRMRDHIHKVVGRYKGRIKGWDVVNEALNDDGTMRQSPWETIIGDDYIIKAFQFAHEADPFAELYYNDYGLENELKRKGAITLLEKLKKAGIPASAIGSQEHDNLQWPPLEQVDATITDFANLGVKVMITELDIDVLPRVVRNGSAEITLTTESQPKLNPYVKGLPDDVQKQLADRYAGLFGVFVKHRGEIKRVTFWCVTDGDSWLNDWPVKGRTSYPLLFDREAKPKPAFDAVLRMAQPTNAP